MTTQHDDLTIEHRPFIVRWFWLLYLSGVALLAIGSLLMLRPAHAQTVDLTVVPTSGVGKATPTLTLAVTGAGTRVVTCTAAGGWSGDKAPGSYVQPEIAATTTYSVTCSAPSIPGSTVAALAWSPPTQHTDGSALTPATDLTGYEINFGTSASALTTVRTQSNPTATGVNVTGLTPGTTYFFCVKAIGKNGPSACSNTTSKTLTASVPAWSQTKSVTVTITAPPIPNPPTNVVTTEITAYQLEEVGDSLVASRIELQPVSTRCDDAQCTVLAKRK